MKKKVIIGIDAGSTHLKAALYTTDGRLIAIRHSRVSVYHPSPSCSEYDADEIWTQLCKCLKELLIPEYLPIAVGISSFGESVVPVDSHGNVMSRMIAWYDMRGQKWMDTFASTYGPSRLFNLTGQFPSGKFTLAKLLWMKINMPDFMKKIHCFLFMQDFISFRLTGKMCTEYSLASRSMLFDTSRFEWCPELLSACGVQKNQLPGIISSGTSAGAVTEAAHRLTGIPTGIPVILAGHDHASASAAAGIDENSSVILDSLGTSETTMFSIPDIKNNTLEDMGIGFYPYYRKQKRYISSIQGCGYSIEWMARMLFDDDIFSRFFQATDYAVNSQLDAPLFLPYLRGLQESPAAAGSLTGLRDIHSRESLCYSVLEGLCFEYKRRLQSAERCTGTSFSRVRAVGRLSHENVFLQLKADILGKPIDVLAQPEAVSQGAAVLAGKFCGLIRKWKPDITVSFLPSSEKKYFKIRFEQYLQEVSRIL